MHHVYPLIGQDYTIRGFLIIFIVMKQDVGFGFMFVYFVVPTMGNPDCGPCIWETPAKEIGNVQEWGPFLHSVAFIGSELFRLIDIRNIYI